jgi:hypothetical protein
VVGSCSRCVADEEEGVQLDRGLRLRDVHSIWEGLWRIGQLAQDAAETLDSRLEI